MQVGLLPPLGSGLALGESEQFLKIILTRAMPACGLLMLCLFIAAWVNACAATVSAITIEVRQFCEISGGCGPGDFFVDNPQALTALRFATKAYEPFTDSLAAIPANPSWIASFTNPETGSSGATIQNLAVPTNTLILYAGGYDMPGGQVAEAGPGTANISLSRGQGTITDSGAYDFATWGGSIAFDTLDGVNPRKWHFGIDTLPGPGQTDFLTIAFHELAHVFGFGTAASFDNLISNNHLLGAEVIKLNGSAPALATDNNHWVSGTTSPPYADPPFSPLSASLLLGRRLELTPLDYAALKDIGWQVPDKLLGLHGDGDQDGDVDGRDFLNWQRNYGQMGLHAGDFDGNQRVDDYDLWLWYTNNGSRLAPPLQTIQIVPEPTLAGLTACWALCLAVGYRTRP
jgi:hypothetical protein